MNNPIVKLGIVLALLLGGGWFGLSSWRTKEAEFKHQLDLERIRKEYLERAPVALRMKDAAKYQFEQAAIFKWYFNELTEHYNRYPAFKNYERFIDDLDERKRAKKVKEADYAQYEERYKLTRALWELARTGRYDPVYTATDSGLRFDVYEVQTLAGTAEPTLRLSYVLWGAQRKWTEDTSSGGRVRRLNVSASFHELVFNGLDADGKPIREMRASGDPFKIDHPERFIEEFPPGVVFGYYDLPKIPAEVVSAELSFEISTRSVLSGEELLAKFVWKQQPVPAEWKLPAGAGWEGAQEQVREDPEAAPAKDGR